MEHSGKWIPRGRWEKQAREQTGTVTQSRNDLINPKDGQIQRETL